MAEVLGIVASSIAVGQLTAEIIKGISKLRGLARYAQDAPRNVQDTLEEIEMMGYLLEELQVNIPSDGSPLSSSAMIHKCIDKCRKAAADINVIVIRLEDKMHGKKARREWSKIQAAFNKEELEDLQRRLNHAKTMLSLAIVCFQTVGSQKQQQSVDQLLKPLPMDNKASVAILKPLSKHGKQPGSLQVWTSMTHKSWWGLGTYIQKSQTRININEHKQEQREETHDSYYFPSYWLSRLAFQFTTASTGGAWKYSLTPIRILPRDSPIFHACLAGDTMEMARLISSGQATIHDCRPTGLSLLHLAAALHDSETAIWLLQHGADSSAVDFYGETPLHRALAPYAYISELDSKLWDDYDSTHRGSRMELTRALIELGKCDPLAKSISNYTALEDFWAADSEEDLQILKYIVKQQEEFNIDIQADDKIDLKMVFYRSGGNAPKFEDYVTMLDILFGKRSIPLDYFNQSIFQFSFSPNGTLLTHFVAMLVSWFEAGDHQGYKTISFVPELLRHGAQLHYTNESGATCLDIILSTYWPWIGRNREELIFRWLLVLHQEGINITNYLRTEQDLHHGGKLIPIRVYISGVERKFEVIYGSDQDAVVIRVWDSLVDRSEELELPGSWDNEAEYMEAHGLRPYELYDGDGKLVDWTVSTVGFSTGDYSLETAGIIPEPADW